MHAVGEAVARNPDGTYRTLARPQLALTFQLEPDIGDELGDKVRSWSVHRKFERH